MAHDWQAYYRLLRALFPRGRAWDTGTGTFKELLEGKAVELSRVDARMDDLLVERDTRTATELLGEHEADFDLPDSCLPIDGSTSARRQALTSRMMQLGSLRPNYYIDIAAALGFTVTIEQFTPAWCGIATAGSACGDQNVIFKWMVDVTWNRSAPKYAEDGLICVLSRIKPAHTVLLYRYVGVQFSSAFTDAFDSAPKLNQGFAFDESFDSAGFNAVMIPDRAGGAFGWEFSSEFDLLIGGAFYHGDFSHDFRTTN